ncbi:hypothetical protein PI125_g20872 [Phytophthora idaei]|nr:hypothetical protein PI125_g20872 [Phytophthora idaei]KAG3133318.1 hypothetical protein PI126_g19234 [Phytophthora idaei]
MTTLTFSKKLVFSSYDGSGRGSAKLVSSDGVAACSTPNVVARRELASGNSKVTSFTKIALRSLEGYQPIKISENEHASFTLFPMASRTSKNGGSTPKCSLFSYLRRRSTRFANPRAAPLHESKFDDHPALP